MSNLTVRDFEQVQSALYDAGLDWPPATGFANRGELRIMEPSDVIVSETTAIFLRLLGNWVYPCCLGR